MINLVKMDGRAGEKLFDYSVLPKQTREAEVRKGCVTNMRQLGDAGVPKNVFLGSSVWMNLCEGVRTK